MKPTIDALLIEDSCSDVQFLKVTVSSLDCKRPELSHVERFDEALAMLEINSFDIVLLDPNLPDGQDLELVRQVKQRFPHIPVVVLTSLQDQAVANATPQEGAQDNVVKTVFHSIAIGIIANLAALYIEEDRYSEAASLLEGALMMRKWLFGDTHLEVALNLYQLATLYDDQGRYKKAEALYRESLELFEKNLGPEHAYTNVIRIKVLLVARINQFLDL